jgi:hypothetical protein
VKVSLDLFLGLRTFPALEEQRGIGRLALDRVLVSEMKHDSRCSYNFSASSAKCLARFNAYSFIMACQFSGRSFTRLGFPSGSRILQKSLRVTPSELESASQVIIDKSSSAATLKSISLTLFPLPMIDHFRYSNGAPPLFDTGYGTSSLKALLRCCLEMPMYSPRVCLRSVLARSAVGEQYFLSSAGLLYCRSNRRSASGSNPLGILIPVLS